MSVVAAGEPRSSRERRRSRAAHSGPEGERCREAERARDGSDDLVFFALSPPEAGCLPFRDDTDTTTSLEIPSCSDKGRERFIYNCTGHR
ncbi:hypothetical protein RR46_06771 [Papilio xuthus]|uniref:Uncharacterized protein n=1 Tax=Papilio xuthus TaxID=66420 RepID=A0A194PRV0_PAPXU|nr:hypothetical protein RR46_06771 [Papilio xuthus]